MADAAIEAEIRRIRASGLLGQGGPLPILFDFLAARTAQGTPPKEIEIAVTVFGKDSSTVTGDASVRVCIHRLRKKLEDFYLREGNAGAARLTIPRGEYRLVLASAAEIPTDSDLEPDEPPSAAKPRPVRALAISIIAMVLILNAAAWLWIIDRRPATGDDTGFLAAINRSNQSLMIVIGDYYLVGESDDGLNVSRLVREFGINSKEDLYTYLMDHPDQMATYSDIGLSYLPTSAGKALQQVVSRLAPNRRVMVMLQSEFPLEALRRNDVIYIGLLSGLGKLRDSVLATSRFTIGESYDEIIDTADGTHYISQAANAVPKGTMYRDYGYVSRFAGPNGNHIAVIAGTRDTAVMGAADAIGQPSFMPEIAARLNGTDAFEALYEVQGAGRVNLQSRLLTVSALDPKKIWSAVANSRLFPPE
ncbi:MAG: helix-turn-helix domain-containing protein [Rhodospirillaceae bacterium]|nr:helix-turn-helix domain-containing protein [Rhodospirillaceae bacterium]